VLGERRKYSRVEVCQVAGVPIEQARKLWRAMGFPDVGDDVLAFTDGDANALRRLNAMIDQGMIDEALAVSITRALGRNLSRLAEWLGEAFTERIARSDRRDLDQAARVAVAEASSLLPETEALVAYVWRRQLAAVARRTLSAAGDGGGELASGRLGVGFADLVGYTRLSRRLTEHQLAEIIERFEERASDIVAAGGGRVVKTVGDEILFVGNTAQVAGEIGLRLAEGMAADPIVPDVRVGLAFGTVLTRLGDVFGTTVNVASRLTAVSRPGSVLVDGGMAAALATVSAFDLRPHWQGRRLRGVGQVDAAFLARAVNPASSASPTNSTNSTSPKNQTDKTNKT
jgi:class 3 adenylate cyclase